MSAIPVCLKIALGGKLFNVAVPFIAKLVAAQQLALRVDMAWFAVRQRYDA